MPPPPPPLLFLLDAAIAIVAASSAHYSSSSPSPASTYDLNEICSKPSTFSLEMSPMHKVVFQLNASGGDVTNPFLCKFSLKTRRLDVNTTLDIVWTNHLVSDCQEFIQVKMPDGNERINLNGSGHHLLYLSNVASIDLYVSLCTSSGHLRIWASTSNVTPGDGHSDVSSIVLAFMAPFAFILLAVVMAVMGSCCCGNKCVRHAAAGGGTSTAEESGTTADGSSSSPASTVECGGGNLLPTASADRPPAYADLFPADYIYGEEAKDAGCPPQHGSLKADVGDGSPPHASA